MPELPEVETIVRALRRVLPGRTIASVDVARANVVVGPPRRFERALAGARIAGVERRAKYIVVRLEDGRVWTTHLRMSGRYRIEPPRAKGARGRRAADAADSRRAADRADEPWVRVRFALDDGIRLDYVDPRTLGEMAVVSGRAWEAKAASLGPEPLDPDFTPERLDAALKKSRRAVKELLLDQSVVAGVGNIYAVEALWRARVSPKRRGANVGPARAARIRDGIVSVLEESIALQGTTFGTRPTDWAVETGEAGGFYDRLDVYDREGEPCRRCGTEIRRIVQAQRSTYYCPACQR